MLLSWCVAWSVAAAAGQAKPFAGQVERGRQYLFAALERDPLAGDAAVPTRAFAVYALFATAPRNGAGQILVDGRMRALAARVRRDADALDGAAWTKSHYGNYGLAALTMCLCAADAEEHRPALRKLVAALLAGQAPHGAWAYPGAAVPDTSQTQFAIAALHDAAACGIDIPPHAWDRAATFLVATQAASGPGAGGFAYNPTLPPDGRPGPQERVTASMAAAGLATLLAARDRLPELQKPRRGPRLPSEVVRPVPSADEPRAFVPTCSRATCDAAILGAERFLARHSGLRGGFATAGREVYFCYALERVAALLKEGPLGKLLDQHDTFVAARQQADGRWDGPDGPLAETALAAMCLGRAAAKKTPPLPPVVMIPPSRLRGGEGIPGMHGHQRPSPAEEAFDAFAAALKDAGDGDAPTAAAVPKAAEDPVRQAWRHARDPRPAVRAAALVALARTRDLTAAPLLLEALGAEDPAVYEAARQGVRLLSRDPEAFGLPPAAQRAAGLAAAAARVKQWVEGLKLEARPNLAYGPTEPVPAAAR